MALSLLIPATELRELDYTTEAPMGNPEYTACVCGYPVKDCKCKPVDEAEECYNCGLFQCNCVFDGYDEEGNPYEYCYSCKGNCMECDCQDFADALLTHSSTATHSISSLHSLQKAYESMGLLPATGWAAELDATATDAAAAPVVDTVCNPEEFCDPEFCENCDMSKQDAKCVCDDYESRQAEDHARDQYEEDRFERYGF